jgi:hypothetical protein
MTAERPPERADMPPPDPATGPEPQDAPPPMDGTMPATAPMDGSMPATAPMDGSMPATPSVALDGAIPSPAVGAGAAGAGALGAGAVGAGAAGAGALGAGAVGAGGNDTPATPVEPSTAEPLVPPAPAEAPVAKPTDAPATATPRRRAAAARGTLRVIQFVVGVGLFVFGIWIGMQVFQSTQKSTDPVGATAVSNGVPTPPVVQEFAHALQTGGPDAVRSSVSTDVFALLASELQRWDYATINKVDVLSTAVDGPRTATGLILTGSTTDGRTMWINLVVHTANGQISMLR